MSDEFYAVAGMIAIALLLALSMIQSVRLGEAKDKLKDEIAFKERGYKNYSTTMADFNYLKDKSVLVKDDNLRRILRNIRDDFEKESGKYLETVLCRLNDIDNLIPERHLQEELKKLEEEQKLINQMYRQGVIDEACRTQKLNELRDAFRRRTLYSCD